MTPQRLLITHLDDVACSRGATEAMFDLFAAGTITSASVMVPSPHFADLEGNLALDGFDLGVHLTLNAESAHLRWAPLSTSDPASGLIDDAGYQWSTVEALRENAPAEAVAGEMRAQVDRALAGGVDVTHIDHHMGAALAPEYVEETVDLAIDYQLPMLFPSNVAGYVDLVHLDRSGVEQIERARKRAVAAGVALADEFVMPLEYHQREDHQSIIEGAISRIGPGVTYLSLHCARPGDITDVHPEDGTWRVREHALFSDPGFAAWLDEADHTAIGTLPFRDRLRKPDGG